MDINQAIIVTSNVNVMTNPILKDVGTMTLRAEINPDGTIQYYMFGNPVEQVPHPLHPAVQSVLDQFIIEVKQRASDAGYVA